MPTATWLALLLSSAAAVEQSCEQPVSKGNVMLQMGVLTRCCFNFWMFVGSTYILTHLFDFWCCSLHLLPMKKKKDWSKAGFALNSVDIQSVRSTFILLRAGEGIGGRFSSLGPTMSIFCPIR